MSDHKNRSRASLQPLNFRTLALSVCGLGFLRPAPGTWGSVPPVAIVAVFVWLGVSTWLLVDVALVLFVAASIACVVFGAYAEKRFGRKDAAEVVADETAGVCVPVIVAVLVLSDTPDRYVGLAGAFVLFRLFDIAKPWPMRRLEQLPAGWGVLVDDLVAGIYA
ncbi:MAG: phosphatidylglycerophosphatase A, partial [Gammaproteobacteria bacterium]|nr:phosphatidylglycerophosphatase A [Gammaproteobacteria bacterium]